jgi:dihydrofolate reductase
MIGIVAVSEDFAIGKDGKLPWHYSADMLHFKSTTMGNVLVMGFNTWRSIGHPLPGRLNIVLSRSAQIEDGDDLIFLRSTDEVLSLVDYLKCDVYIMGGAKTYSEFAPFIDRWVVTSVPVRVPDADTFLPRDLLDGFTETAAREIGDCLIVRELRKKPD